MKLDFGCGQRPREGFTGIDLVKTRDDVVEWDLCSGTEYPFEDNSINEMHSFHFIEHIVNDEIMMIFDDKEPQPKDALFFFFDEAFRIAKPDCKFTLIWPALQSVRAFQDPTHRRYIPFEMLQYLSIEGRKTLGVEHYDVNCNWVVIEQTALTNPGVDGRMAMIQWNGLVDYQAILRAEKSYGPSAKGVKFTRK